jgi:predicted XRE-type DNA-binding protein
MSTKKAEYFATQISRHLPQAKVALSRPARPGGVWTIDVDLGRHEVVVQWSSKRGFGLSTPTDDDYATSPGEVIADADRAVARTVELLRGGQRTRPRREMFLQKLREQRQISQESLADLIGVRQGSVSKAERREDMLISTLRAFVEALGGELELIARFPEENISLKLPPPERTKTVRVR